MPASFLKMIMAALLLAFAFAWMFEDYGLSLPEGVAIQWVDPQGPIGKVGFEVGDVILTLGDQPVQGVDSFSKMMTSMPPHQKVVLLAISHRSGQSGYVQVEIL